MSIAIRFKSAKQLAELGCSASFVEDLGGRLRMARPAFEAPDTVEPDGTRQQWYALDGSGIMVKVPLYASVEDTRPVVKLTLKDRRTLKAHGLHMAEAARLDGATVEARYVSDGLYTVSSNPLQFRARKEWQIRIPEMGTLAESCSAAPVSPATAALAAVARAMDQARRFDTCLPKTAYARFILVTLRNDLKCAYDELAKL